MKSSPILPVYLNQRMVFDLLAMLEGGIAHVTRIESGEQATESGKQHLGTSFGLGKAFSSLLSISVSGDGEKTQSAHGESRRVEERIHTPASLFARLRDRLHEGGMVHLIDDQYIPKTSDLVEFKASLTRNPLLQTMDSMISLMRLAIVFTDSPSADSKLPQKPGSKPIQKAKNSAFENTLEQMILFRDQLGTGGTADICAEGILGGGKALLTVETDSLNDPAMADLVDGEFIVLGKIIKTVVDHESSISLIRKSALTAMPRKAMEEMFSKLSHLSTAEDFNLPALRMEISGPAFQVLPVAIFA